MSTKKRSKRSKQILASSLPANETYDPNEWVHTPAPPSPENDQYRAAATLAENGFFVFPILFGSKDQPITRHGHKDATRDIALITLWWNLNPDANIGIDLKQSGLLVIGPDSRSWLTEFQQRGLPETMIVQSASGPYHRHYYFRLPPGAPIHRLIEQDEYDILSNGYVVAAPSELTKERSKIDGHYTLLTPMIAVDDLPLAPAWAVEMLHEQPAPPSDQPAENESAIKTDFGEVMKAMMSDESMLPQLVHLLDIPADVSLGKKFLCPLGCGERDPSAAFWRGKNNVLKLHTFHDCKDGREFWLLPEVYHGRTTGSFEELKGQRLSAWTLMLLRDAGTLTPTPMPPLPNGLSNVERNVAAAFFEIYSLAMSAGIESIAFGYQFAIEYSKKTEHEIRVGWRRLKARKIVTQVRPYDKETRTPGLWKPSSEWESQR